MVSGPGHLGFRAFWALGLGSSGMSSSSHSRAEDSGFQG